MHTVAPPPSPQKHFLCPCIYTSLTPQSSWDSLTDCTCSNMCSEWAALPVNRLPTAQTENMYSSLRAVVSNHWLACSKCFHSPLTFLKGWKKLSILRHTCFLVSRQSAILYLHVTKHCPFHTGDDLKKVSLVNWEINCTNSHATWCFHLNLRLQSCCADRWPLRKTFHFLSFLWSS